MWETPVLKALLSYEDTTDKYQKISNQSQEIAFTLHYKKEEADTFTNLPSKFTGTLYISNYRLLNDCTLLPFISNTPTFLLIYFLENLGCQNLIYQKCNKKQRWRTAGIFYHSILSSTALLVSHPCSFVIQLAITLRYLCQRTVLSAQN